jgi:hypothetical protein
MEKTSWIAILVAIVGAATTWITAQAEVTSRLKISEMQETTRLELLQSERREELRSSLILSAIATDDHEEAIATLLFCVNVGLIDGPLGDGIRTYVRSREDAEPSDPFPRFRPLVEGRNDMGIAAERWAEDFSVTVGILNFLQERGALPDVSRFQPSDGEADDE